MEYSMVLVIRTDTIENVEGTVGYATHFILMGQALGSIFRAGINAVSTNVFYKAVTMGSRLMDYCVNKHDFDSQPDRCCGGNSGTLSVEMDVHASGIGRHNLTEPVTWYYKFLGSRTIMEIVEM